MALRSFLITSTCAVALLAGCASGGGSPAARMATPEKIDVTAPDNQIPAASPRDMDGFFAMNAITPYHHWVAGGDVRANAISVMEQNLDAAQEAGATSVRVDAWWHVIEPQQDVWDWELTDAVIAAMTERGLEPYPILCYGAAWNQTKPPITEQGRDDYAEYVRNFAERYGEDVYYYEIWNEPNIPMFWESPNAELYTQMLQRAYAEIKAADPDSLVVGICTADTDLSYIEGVLRAGGGDYLDAISFHPYSNTPDEAELEEDMRHVREIMRRYGHAHKPLLITEVGLSTGESPVLQTVDQDYQARWTVKKQLTAIANGLEKFYYFKLIDDAPESNPDGFWGMLDWNREPKKLWFAQKALTERIGNATYLGRAHRVGSSPARKGDAEVQVYEAGDEFLGIGWVRADGDDLAVTLPATGPVVVEDMYGNEMQALQPSGGEVRIPLSKEPRFLRGLSPEAAALAAVSVEPPTVFVTPGRTDRVKVTVRNPTDAPLNADMSIMTAPPAASLLRIDGPQSINVEPGRTETLTYTVTRQQGEPATPGGARLVRNTGDVSYAVDFAYETPFRVELYPRKDGDQITVRAEARNSLNTPVGGRLTWRLNGLEQADATAFSGLAPQAVAQSSFTFDPWTGEQTITAVAETEAGAGAREFLRTYGIDMASEPPVIDGAFDGDWNDPPVVRMLPVKQRRELRSALGVDAETPFSGEIRALFTDTHLYLGAEVTDTTPLINPHGPDNGVDVWKGDALEVYIGFPGPTTDTQYPAGFHQFIISPGDDGEGGYVWNFRPLDREAHPDGRTIEGAEVAASETEDGYIVEVAIPLFEFAQTIEPYQVLAFDMHLNNRITDAEGAEPEHILIWNGDRDNWRDPSDWGVAVVLPDPATLPPSPGRSQLFGGAPDDMKISEAPTRDAAYLTPLPMEKSEFTAHAPDWLALELPFDGPLTVSGGYGMENRSWTHQTIGNKRSANDYFAIDFDAPMRTPLYAAASGRIVQSNRRGDSYGHYVVIDHGGGYQTIYAHLDERVYEVDKGEPEITVEAGDLIGWSGTSGTSFPHLHFALHYNSRASHSGANVAGITVVPEPLGGYYGIREGHELTRE